MNWIDDIVSLKTNFGIDLYKKSKEINKATTYTEINFERVEPRLHKFYIYLYIFFKFHLTLNTPTMSKALHIFFIV